MVDRPRGARHLDWRRAFDAAVAGTLLLGALPLLGVLSCLVRRAMGRPVLYRQERAGLDAKPFVLVKFRTMTDVRGEDGSLLEDDRRLTPFGRRMRALSLDELPELWNVLKGDMALVGPRPLPLSYLSRYTDVEARRHEVRPGLTGWAQVSGRNSLSWDERLSMDVWYVDNRSFTLDMKILLRTVAVVARGSGVSARGHATMPELPRRRDR